MREVKLQNYFPPIPLLAYFPEMSFSGKALTLDYYLCNSVMPGSSCNPYYTA